ncbi:MAG: hypothetical protein MJZ76_07425 [Bacteroidales bacterium]|nr:hypothetical protein [Bacteroidales bacterium]
MYYYKFRVYYDEIEDFVRDIEILSTDNFESFHNILYSSIGLSGNELASISICDAKWNKQKEIMLMDMEDDMETQEAEYDEDDDFSTKSNLPKFVMADSIIKNFITDPHQHLMYEYDFLNPKVFYIELLKTLQTDSAKGFPRCTFSEKELPKPVKPLKDPDDQYVEEISMDELEDDDDFGFEDGYNEEDQIGFDQLDGFNEF